MDESDLNSTTTEDLYPNSILKTIRAMIGPGAEYEYFDTALITHINSAFSRLCRLAVGPEVPFKITGIEEEWDDFIDDGYQEEVKEYVYLKVRTVFDPGSLSPSVLSAFNDRIQELEWELNDVGELGY